MAKYKEIKRKKVKSRIPKKLIPKAERLIPFEVVKKAKSGIVKKVAKTALKRIGPVATVLTAAEIAKGAAKGARKVGASLKAKKACESKGSVYRKGFCISSKAIKAKSLKKK